MWFVAVIALAAAALWLSQEGKLTTRSLPADVRLGQVPPVQQLTPWTCGPAALRAVLAHYGIEASEQAAALAVGNRDHVGVRSEGLLRGARLFGLDGLIFRARSLDALRPALAQGLPVLAVVDSWTHPGRQGHWVVIKAVGAREIVVMDPNTPGNIRRLSRADFDARWWNYERAASGQVYRAARLAVVVAPIAEEPPLSLSNVEVEFGGL